MPHTCNHAAPFPSVRVFTAKAPATAVLPNLHATTHGPPPRPHPPARPDPPPHPRAHPARWRWWTHPAAGRWRRTRRTAQRWVGPHAIFCIRARTAAPTGLPCGSSPKQHSWTSKCSAGPRGLHAHAAKALLPAKQPVAATRKRAAAHALRVVSATPTAHQPASTGASRYPSATAP